jgi:hypothetical protein
VCLFFPMLIALVQHTNMDEKADPRRLRQQLKVADWLRRYVYGRTRRINFTQLIQRQWLQYPLPYDRLKLRIPTPDWLADREGRLRVLYDGAIGSGVIDEADDYLEADGWQEAEEVSDSDSEAESEAEPEPTTETETPAELS